MEEESFDTEEFNASLIRNDMNFYKEKLQTQFTCRTRWLLGLHSIAFNARNLEVIIEQLAEFNDIPVEVRMEPICTKRGSAKNLLNRDSKDAKTTPYNICRV
jgi:hypothetical protein